jgi:hypothetical protein
MALIKNMKTLFFTLSIFFLSCAPRPQPLNCKQFRNGKFKSEVDGRTYVVERSGSNQKEYFINTKDSLTAYLTVKWLDDCTYTLTPSEETLKKTPKIPKNAMLTVSITNTTSNSYTQTSTLNFNNSTTSSLFIKIQ